MEIGNVHIDGNLFLAPMAGVTDVGFRHVAKKYGADFTSTEMISASGLVHNSKKTEHLLLRSPRETKMAVQLFGKEPKIFKQALENELLKNFDVVDINMGCPAPKIVKNGEGSALLTNLKTAEEIIKTVVASSNKPVTVKMRKGFLEGETQCFTLAKICEDCGVSAITIHGRTKEQGYSGKVDYDTIANVKTSVKIPVIGNGDIFDTVSLEKMEQTGVDGCMIARGVLGKPWIFSLLKGENNIDKYSTALEHVNYLRAIYPNEILVKYLRKHFLWYTLDLPNGAEQRKRLATLSNLDEALAVLKTLLKDE